MGVCVCVLSSLRVGVSVRHNHELYWNGWTDRDAVWNVDSGGPEGPCIRRGPESPGDFGGLHCYASFRQNSLTTCCYSARKLLLFSSSDGPMESRRLSRPERCQKVVMHQRVATKRPHRRSTPVITRGGECRVLLRGGHVPAKVPLPVVVSGPHRIHGSLSHARVWSQTACDRFIPFCAAFSDPNTDWETHTQSTLRKAFVSLDRIYTMTQKKREPLFFYE